MAKSDNSPYLALASLGLTLAQGYASNKIQKAESKLREAQVAGANSNRLSKNIERGAEAGLMRFMQSMNNNRRLKAAGQQRDAGVQTMIRTQDNITTTSIEQQLREAESQGAYAANAAKSGMMGNSVDMIDITMRMKNTRQRAAVEQNNKYLTYDMAQQIAGVIPQAVEGLDATMYNAGMDTSTNMAYSAKSTGHPFFDLLRNPNLKDVFGLFGSNGEDYKMIGPGLNPEATGVSLEPTGGEGLRRRSKFAFNTPSTSQYSL
jgi:hypothetical protein